MPIFRVHQLVHPEFREARAWYENRSALAAENFALRFDAALGRVAERPTSHAPWRSIFRRCKVSQFPYLIFFHADHRFTSVLMLAHKRLEPEKLLATVRERSAQFA